MIGGKKREVKDFSKKVGLMEVEVISVNPDREELSNLLGNEMEKDPEYLGEFQEKDEQGNEVGVPLTKLNVVIWVKDKKTEAKYPIYFTLIDKERTSKTGKKQYINTIGATSWSDAEGNLGAWFKKRDFRVARVGEEELMAFMRSWLSELDFRSEETTLELDWKKLMKGNVKEIRELVGGEYCGSVVVMATVRSVDKDGERKEYQGIYNKEFLPGYTMKFFRATKFTEEKIENLRVKQANLREEKKGYLKPFEEFVLKVTDSEYGIKDAYYLGEAKDYNPEEHLQGSDKTIDTSDPSY